MPQAAQRIYPDAWVHPLYAHRNVWCGLGCALSVVLLVLGLRQGKAGAHRIQPAPAADHAVVPDTTQRWSDACWHTDRRPVRTDEKSNEITAIPNLLEILEVSR